MSIATAAPPTSRSPATVHPGEIAPSEPVVEVVELTKTFQDVRAVENLDLAVYPGEVLGFLGPNGSGKSTTVSMILGLVRPTSGYVNVFGRDISEHPHLVAEHIGAIIENPAFYPHLSGRDNLKAHALAVGEKSDARIDELLETVGLSDRAHHAFQRYSLGMKQRLGIASTLLTNPPLVVLDEPTNGLDPAGQREIRDIIPRLADEGHAVLLASHLLHEVEQVCDRVAIIRRGKLIEEGSVDDLLRRSGYIETRVPVEQIDAAKRALRVLPGVEQVTVERSTLSVIAPDTMCGTVNRTLFENGILAETITPKQSTLEDLFLEMTADANGDQKRKA